MISKTVYEAIDMILQMVINKQEQSNKLLESLAIGLKKAREEDEETKDDNEHDSSSDT